jgi:hypothetical protein
VVGPVIADFLANRQPRRSDQQHEVWF